MAFMVPLVKNHYEIYNTRSAFSDHDNGGGGYMIGSSNHNLNRRGRTTSQSSESNKKSTAAGSQVVLNGMVLLNGRSKSKPKVVLSSASRGAKGQSQPIQVQQPQQNKTERSSMKNSSSYSSTQSMNHATRLFPHVRRTVRNPITNRVYSYSVSIPEYVAEEDEEELARLELEESLEQCESPTLDQVMIFSTSAPAGTGSIENGIIDIVDEDDFIRCTGARLPPTIRTQTKKSKRNASFSSTSMSHSSSLPSSPVNKNLESSFNDETKSPTNDRSQFERCNSSNSREYMELLHKFILHLKMLKLKRIFNPKTSNSTAKECRQRDRSSTLDDSINL
ncbi:hypothetical protein BLA29_006096 [Euroglyphus maynei]|uniref:Uncharacterized protein n=1 Tax=Euroglyphus maynei TaxID=6958 RepID=A0A1Y3ASN7_EURMA|nr:hypothetical protein BLA29_006096 [Euroglyphus maynei]